MSDLAASILQVVFQPFRHHLCQRPRWPSAHMLWLTDQLDDPAHLSTAVTDRHGGRQLLLLVAALRALPRRPPAHRPSTQGAICTRLEEVINSSSFPNPLSACLHLTTSYVCSPSSTARTGSDVSRVSQTRRRPRRRQRRVRASPRPAPPPDGAPPLSEHRRLPRSGRPPRQASIEPLDAHYGVGASARRSHQRLPLRLRHQLRRPLAQVDRIGRRLFAPADDEEAESTEGVAVGSPSPPSFPNSPVARPGSSCRRARTPLGTRSSPPPIRTRQRVRRRCARAAARAAPVGHNDRGHHSRPRRCGHARPAGAHPRRADHIRRCRCGAAPRWSWHVPRRFGRFRSGRIAGAPCLGSGH